MTEKNNATCSICGGEYYACFSCKESMNLHPWKLHCCSASHFQVFQAVRGLSTGVYSKDEFKYKLNNIDLADLETYREHIKSLIKDALRENKVVDTPIIEDSVIEEVTTEENLIVDKPVYSRKRNYKVEE